MEELDKINNLGLVDKENNRINNLKIISTFLRKDVLDVITTANSGHIWGCLSSVELLTALYFGWVFKFDIKNSKNPNRDRVLVRWHLGPIRYSIFSLMWYIQRNELWTYRQLGSRLQGHEDMFEMPGVDITPSWSLWMLLSYGVGSAIESKNVWRNNKTIVFLWDWEEQEGNISEAARHASSIGLNNLICIIDKNWKQLSRPTKESDAGSDLETIWKWYWWNIETINNGHDLEEILSVYKKLQNIRRPTVVIANTIKWYGVPWNKDHFSWYHTLSSVSNKEVVHQAIEELSKDLEEQNVTIEWISKVARSYISSIIEKPLPWNNSDIKDIYDIRYNWISWINLEEWQSKYFAELQKRILENLSDPQFYMITPDLLRKDIVEKDNIDKFSHFIDTWIREQHAIAMAHGISVENPDTRIYVCYGDAFLYRAMDQINAATQWKSNILINWENSWIFQWQNGKTHQSVWQSWGMYYIPEDNFYDPSDVVDLYNVYSKVLTENKGISYVRFHRWTVNLERNDSDRNSTDAYYVHKPDNFKFTIIASGFMVENAVNAAKKMELEYWIPTAVINIVNHKTLSTSLPKLLENSSPILTVYNWNPEILRNSVSWAIFDNIDIPKPKFIKWHGFLNWTSWKVNDLIKFYKLDADWIMDIAMGFVKDVKLS